ncbi:MAG: hypothetical protein WCO22_06865 [Betaproteobacteria bacterium]
MNKLPDTKLLRPVLVQQLAHQTASPIEKVLGGLTKARQRQPGQWSACCPAHADRGPSLSVRETPEGAVLVHCFAGCTVDAVLGALGLELSDLFPPREKSGREPQRQPRLLTAPQALELLEAEATFIAVAARNIANGVTLTQPDLDRLLLAAGRVGWLRDQSLGGAHHA